MGGFSRDAVPPYLFSHSGVVLVCGNAFSLLDDYARARGLYPDAPVIAVKGAAEHVKAFAVFGLHPRKMPRMVDQQRRIHSEFTTHMGGDLVDRTRLGVPIRFTPDYRWPLAVGGSSGWAARKMAAFMGFDLVILCGIPLSIGGYCGNVPSRPFQSQKIIDIYRREVFADTEFHAGARSMSGWTMEVFGCA